MSIAIQVEKVVKTAFGTYQNRPVDLYTLNNKNGHQVSITNFGGIITSWLSPDKKGEISDIVVGFTTLEEYLDKTNYHFGGIIGRYANRIANGKFAIDDKNYQLPINNHPHHLHGGNIGFDQVVWDAHIKEGDSATIILSYLSKDGEEGYPGNVQLEVSYTLTEKNELIIQYKAQTDKTTHLNLTNHSYFNLSGNVNNSILHHQIQINANYYLDTDKTALPTGEIRSVDYTAFNLNALTFIDKNISELENGYDHNFILNKKDNEFALAAILKDIKSGRTLEVRTTEPGIQFYTGNFLDGKIKDSNGTLIKKQCALCLETQHFPDSPNQSHFPDTLLHPYETFYSKTSYQLFSE
jgi:aldose 1-epimerase